MSRVDMSPEAVTRRLRLVGELSDLGPEAHAAGKVDMSPEGVTRRLRQASQLSKLCRSLERAGRSLRP